MNNKKITALVNNYNKRVSYPVTNEDFIYHAKRYIKAIKQRRMMCSIDKVSASGMSRTLKFIEMSGSSGFHNIYNFFQLFDILGYQRIKHSDYFRIHGCGMDMVFNTNYNNIHELQSLGFITKKTCDKLAQMTPHIV